MDLLLYLNGKLCKGLSELQEVIKTNLYKDGDVFFDLLDSGKSGELEVWMKQMSEAELADELCDLDKELDDVEYVSND